MRFADLTAWAGELCLYLCTVGFLLSPAGDAGGMALVLAVSVAAGWACARWSGRGRLLRYLPALLMVPLFPIAGSLGTALRPAPVLILLLVRCRAGRWRGEYYTVRGLFKTGGLIYAALFLAFALSGHIGRLAADSFPFFTVWLLLTVLSLRLLRNPYVPGLDGRSKALNAALLLAVVLAVAALSADVTVSAVTAVLAAVWRGVVVPAVLAAAYLTVVLFALLTYPFGYLFWLLTRDGAGAEPPEPINGAMQELLSDILPEEPEPSRWLLRAAAVLGVGLFLFLAWRLARLLLSPERPEARETGVLRRESAAPAGGKARRPGRRAMAGGVREVYRKYLALCASLGIPVDGSVASDVIRDLSAPYTSWEDAEALRRQWLQARFSGREPSPEDVKQARALLRRMRTSAKARRNEAQHPS